MLYSMKLLQRVCLLGTAKIIPGGGGTPIYGLYRYVRPQRVWFSAVLVINRVSIIAIVVINRVPIFAL